MPNVTGVIPNLINGISQQSQSMRLPSQAEVSDNFYPTIIDGNRRRPRTEHLAALSNFPADTFTHFIFRDTNEKYVCAITTAGAVYVWDMAGNAKTVTNNGASYLSGITSAKDDLRALTVADYTFVVNKKKVVQAGTSTAPTRSHEALINVLAGNYGKDYSINVNGTVVAHFQTPVGGNVSQAPYIDTHRLAQNLYDILVGGVANMTDPGGYADKTGTGLTGTGWSVGLYGSTIHIVNTETDFTIGCSDGYNGRAMKAIKGSISKFADLPLSGPDGFTVKVTASPGITYDDYYVKLVKGSNYNTTGEGNWEECVAPGTVLGLNAATMPHTLVRNSDGTFTFGPATWDGRQGGSAEDAPDPSFVGHTINDLFFHRNRLGILSSESVVMTEAGHFFNFYRSTMTALLDSDPVDVSASHVKVSFMRHAVPFQDVLLLFTDNTQFKLAGNDLLTPKTVNTRPLTELASLPSIRPVVAASSVYFPSEREGWASLWEFYLDKQLNSASAEEATAHAPAYIPAGVKQLVAAPDLDLILIKTDGDKGSLYGHKFYWQGEQKIQSAWFRWTFPGCDEVVNVEFDKGILYMLMRRGSMVYLEKLNAEQRQTDSPDEFMTYLDRHVRLTGTYSGSTQKTTFTLPYTPSSDIKCVTSYAEGAVLPPGVELTPTLAGMSITFDGDISSVPIRFGYEFESRYRFSRFLYRGPDGKQAQLNGRLTLRHFNLVYSDAAYFKLLVSPEGRPTREYPFNGRIIGDPENMTGKLVTADGRMNIPIFSRNDRVVIEIVNEKWLPSAFSSAEWRGMWNPSSREL